MSNLSAIPGEASESDEEENVVLSVCNQSLSSKKINPIKGNIPHASVNSGVVVAGEASESDNESDDACRLAFMARSGTVQNDSDDDVTESAHYDTLLHKKLRECNSSLYKNVCKQSRQGLFNAVKMLNSTNQQLVSSQVMIQDSASALGKAFNHLSKLEDSLNSLLAIPYIPEIKLS